MDNVHFSSESDEWETPQWLFDQLNAEFNFVADMAATPANTKCPTSFQDSLDIDWVEMYDALVPRRHDEETGEYIGRAKRYLWCNPPYSRGKQSEFLKRGYNGMLFGVRSVFLIPARTDTKAWHDFVWDQYLHRPYDGVEVRLLCGRLKFEKDGQPVLDKNGRPQSAPFPSALVVYHGG